MNKNILVALLSIATITLSGCWCKKQPKVVEIAEVVVEENNK